MTSVQGKKCLNCGEATGPYFCPHCGQEADIRQGPLLRVAREVLSDWLSLDSRLLRSLRTMLRPGRLSDLYVEGKRAPFLRPFRLYLLASLVLFSTLLTLEPPVNADFDLTIAGKLVGPKTDGRVRRSMELFNAEGFPDRWIVELAGPRVDRLLELPRPDILELIFSGLRRMLPSTLILFVPFLALGLKLLYVRGRARRTQYLDHLVFALHFQSALFFALSVAWLLTRPLEGETAASAIVYGLIAMMILVFYLPLSLRRFYGQSWRWTVIKSLAVVFVYSQLLGLAVDLSVLVAIWRV